MTRQAKVALITLAVAVIIGLVAAFAWPTIYREFIAPPAAAAPQGSMGADADPAALAGGSLLSEHA